MINKKLYINFLISVLKKKKDINLNLKILEFLSKAELLLIGHLIITLLYKIIKWLAIIATRVNFLLIDLIYKNKILIWFRQIRMKI